jgi:alanine racemase
MKECFIEINVDNLQSNFNWYKSQTKNKFICPMIKANAYGVGLEVVFQALKSAGADHVGIVRLSEAKTVRALDSNINILMFNPCDEEDFEIVVDLQITPVISSMQSLKSLAKILRIKSITSFDVHIEIDTGMNRLGFKQNDLKELFDFLKLETRIKPVGVFSHFLKAEDWPDINGKSYAQLKLFNEITNLFKKLIREEPILVGSKNLIFHLSSSKALNDESRRSELNSELLDYGIRPGLGLYGISQSNKSIKRVVSLKAPIVDLKWINEGETVSYDGIWTAERKTLLGVLPIGYGDGYPRSLMGKSYVLVSGQKAPIIGKICMDFMMIDLTDLVVKSNVSDLSEDILEEWKAEFNQKLNQEYVLIFGGEVHEQGQSIEELSDLAGIISYEFIVGLSSRIKRVVVRN